MDQDPSFPPLSCSLLAEQPTPTQATVDATPNQYIHKANTSCSEERVEECLEHPESQMRRCRSDSEIQSYKHSTSVFSHRKVGDPPFPALKIPKVRPSIAIDLLPGIPPTPEALPCPPLAPFTLLCPKCRHPRPFTPEVQATTVCKLCLADFKNTEKTGMSSQRRGSVLTSFPPLLVDIDNDSYKGGDEERSDRDCGESRKLSIVEGISFILGMLRGGALRGRKSSRSGSESSLDSWSDSGSGGSGSRSASPSSMA